jgi:hypothetical protein
MLYRLSYGLPKNGSVVETEENYQLSKTFADRKNLN